MEGYRREKNRPRGRLSRCLENEGKKEDSKTTYRALNRTRRRGFRDKEGYRVKRERDERGMRGEKKEEEKKKWEREKRGRGRKKSGRVQEYLWRGVDKVRRRTLCWRGVGVRGNREGKMEGQREKRKEQGLAVSRGKKRRQLGDEKSLRQRGRKKLFCGSCLRASQRDLENFREAGAVQGTRAGGVKIQDEKVFA
jgi:hypothetical protein